MEHLVVPLPQPWCRYILAFVYEKHRAYFGIDLGKVLAGIQVPPNEAGEFDEFLRNLGYPYVEETDNEMYKKYLRG